MYKNLGKFHESASNKTDFENSGESHVSQTEAHNIATC